MLLPLFSNVRYTPLTEKPWSDRRAWASILKYAGLVLSAALLLLAAVHLSGVKRINLPHNESDPSSSPAPGEPLLGVVRGPDIVIPQIPKDFKTVGMVFFLVGNLESRF